VVAIRQLGQPSFLAQKLAGLTTTNFGAKALVKQGAGIRYIPHFATETLLTTRLELHLSKTPQILVVREIIGKNAWSRVACQFGGG
jgi:hypothetical protein